MDGSFVPRAATDMARDPVTRPTKAPGSSPLSGMWRLLLEVFLAIALTLACFSGFLAVLSVVFPPGDDIRTLMAGVRLTGSREAYRSLAAELLDPIASASSPVAKLTVQRRDVKRRLAGQITWSPAASGLELHDRDAVQTGPDGRASIDFGPKVAVQVEENALVVVSGLHLGADPVVSPRGLVLLQGDLLAQIRGSYEAPILVDIPAGHAVLHSAPGGTADFRIDVGRDRATSVAVRGGGSVELAAKGRRVRVGPSEFSRVDSVGQIQEPRAIPMAPIVMEPADGASFPYLDLPPRVTFRWSPVEGADRYRVRAVKAPAFRDLALDEVVTTPLLTWGRLPVGSYRWYVVAIQDEIEGLPSAARGLAVTLDGELLPLRVQAPPPQVDGSRLTVRGYADPRARVYVMAQRVDVNRDGSFEVEVRLKAGANVLLVEAVDPAGHSSYWSQVLRAKF